MKLSQTTINTLSQLRALRDTASTANKAVTSKADDLTMNIINDALELYIADKATYTSYNNFISLYENELMQEVDENEKSLINIISMVTFTLSKGLKNKCTLKQIKAIFKYSAFITYANLTDNKSIKAEITSARNAYETELKSNNVALVTTLDKKSSLQLAVIAEVTGIIKRDVKKAEKKAIADAKKN